MELKEPDLFEYLKEFYYKDLEKSDEFDTWDCVSKEHKVFIELKSRKTHYNELLIEEIKYKALLDNAGMRSLTPWYINSTPEGIWGFNLARVAAPEWKDKWLPSATEFPGRGSRTKLVGFLHINQGTLL